MTLPESKQTTGAHSATSAPMRNVISLMHVSLDGFVAGPNGEMDWIAIDEEIYRDVADVASTVDTAIYGRTTYQMMESYWPSVPANPTSTNEEIHHAHWVENVQKIVFSKTLENVGWNNTRLVKGNIAQEIARLKRQPGKNLMIFGSPGPTHAFIQRDLIDDYRITVNPVVLGSGIPLFKGVKEKIALKLLESKTFGSGVVGLHYRKEANGGEQ